MPSLLLFSWLVCRRTHLDQQMRVRQLMHGHRRSCRPVVSEKFTIDFVVSREVIHIHQVGGNLHYISQLRSIALQNVANVLDHRASLRANIEARSTQGIDFCAGNRVIRPSSTRTRNEQEISGTFQMRIFPTGRRSSLDYFAVYIGHRPGFTIECKCYSARNRNSVNACRPRGRFPKVQRRRMESASRAGTSNLPRLCPHSSVALRDDRAANCSSRLKRLIHNLYRLPLQPLLLPYRTAQCGTQDRKSPPSHSAPTREVR